MEIDTDTVKDGIHKELDLKRYKTVIHGTVLNFDKVMISDVA